MKSFIFRIAFALVAILFLTPSVSGQIVGGAGFIKTSGNPNTVTSLTTIDQRYTASFVWDTTAQVLYKYDRTLASGARWVAVPTGTPAVTSVVGAGDITATNVGGVVTVTYSDLDKNPTNEAQTLSSAAVSANSTKVNLSAVSGVGGGTLTITGGSGITLTGTANNLTITNPAYSGIVADNPAHAATLAVAVGQSFVASLTNTMGVPAGTIVRRMF
jgi:hypothetical protein